MGGNGWDYDVFVVIMYIRGGCFMFTENSMMFFLARVLADWVTCLQCDMWDEQRIANEMDMMERGGPTLIADMMDDGPHSSNSDDDETYEQSGGDY